ncbi:adenosylcobinamide-GDP ribazoletransferase [Sulfodiicoccus acidiphilus]|uniref:Adenosylcobinamide-GDP ribazoletransferase n=1 Tax=Sulfodiicoccus acidiphilus TaxID=1670455 RepID=A0A348B3M7_9CREN|nr:adenosylcobinamide-GDP ribazoletransferase [Sulfodiicoccus acidiphilus]BBD72779.1 adenosylcobinamide-GDP ribazoletransferase [Sulfodiicoccus acidiphilus]GGT99740.1 adenosylcobinamide-GDP ribazoletransferase [Sulfodiicoccus acidiphilus]
MISSLLSFYSTIPAGGDLDTAASWSFIAPILVGVLEGIVLFIVLFAAWNIFDEPAAGLLVAAAAEGLRGFHHLDGLLDIGDALMVKDKEKRLRALKDFQLGTGAAGALLLYLFLIVPTVMLLRPTFTELGILVAASVTSRSVGLLQLALERPIQGSFLGSKFSEGLSGKAWVLMVESSLFLTSPWAVTAFLGLTALWLQVSRRSLGGSSGDVVGAAITSSFPLILLAELKWPWFWFLHLHW